GEAAAVDGRHLTRNQPSNRAEGPRDRLARIEDLEPLAATTRPSAGGGIAAANQIVDLVDMARPVDVGFGLAHPAFIGSEAFVLRRAGSAGDSHVGGFQKSIDAGGKDLIEVEAAD